MSGDDLVAYMYFISEDDLVVCIVWLLNYKWCALYFLCWLTYIYCTTVFISEVYNCKTQIK